MIPRDALRRDPCLEYLSACRTLEDASRDVLPSRIEFKTLDLCHRAMEG